ncbi:PDZ domain-containing protein [Nocardiopsis sp. MG754419]|uniref:YlbL family protein n=1 Tax=Nocardiopsis sp. MG754419 TaxID=2259865 RepID=UPI001BAD5021|nr:S16 family serine protease [Nocardiopsis sp. MG754419]MBR8741359.1 PDZ/DHR/GLGF domain-containing protein [Nocardiopsis sp. MG754419]
MTLVAALVLLAGLGYGSLLLPMPYLVAAPGVTLDTLGEQEDGAPIIGVDGAENYEHDGSLSMVTVQYAGGPEHRLNLFTLVTAWLSPSQAVLPEELLFPAGRSQEEVTERQTVQMNDSQTDATAAALNQLNIDYEAVPLVADAVEGMPAEGVVEPGDRVLEVDGEPVPTSTTGNDPEELVGSAYVVEQVGSREIGDPVDLVLDRDDEKVEVALETVEGEGGSSAVGILIADDMDFPVDIDISVGEIGGPSAGMMFALGIVDRLSEESITGGARIAGSGTISSDGRVGGVSGIPQKMVSAQRDGADHFLVAAESCSQVAQSAAYGELDVVQVETLTDAMDALETIREGGDDLPRCE